MKILVVIPTLGKREGMLKETLASLEAQTRPADEIRVVREGTSAWWKINKAVRESDCDAFFVISDDDLVLPRYLEVTAGVMEKWGADIVTTPLENFGAESSVHACGKLPFMSSLASRRIFDLVGGYDEDSGIAGDTEFWISCIEAGARWERTGDLPPLFQYRKWPGQWSNLSHSQWDETMDYIKKKHPNWSFT